MAGSASSRRVVLTVRAESGCPLYSAGDQLVLHLPGVDTAASSAVCALAVAKYLAETDGGACPEVFPPAAGFVCPRAERPTVFDVEPVAETHVPAPISSTTTDDLPTAVAQLRAVPIFRALPAAFLGEVAAQLTIETYPDGGIIVEKGQPGRAFFVVGEGTVEVVDRTDDELEAVVHVLGARDCFGEMALLTGAPAIATVRARGEVEVQVLEAKFFHRMLHDHPFMAARFARLLASRLVAANYLLVREESQSFRGKLSVMGFSTVLQVVAEARRSGRLHLRAPSGEGAWVGYREGRVFDAACGSFRAREAVYALLSWERGDFWLEAAPVPDADRVELGVTGLLLEGMRRIDEGVGS